MIRNNGNLIRIEPFKVNAIDTTGAGDLYAAGFLYGLSRNYPLEKCGKLGSFLAAKVVTQVGARLEMDVKEEIKNIL